MCCTNDRPLIVIDKNNNLGKKANRKSSDCLKVVDEQKSSSLFASFILLNVSSNYFKCELKLFASFRLLKVSSAWCTLLHMLVHMSVHSAYTGTHASAHASAHTGAHVAPNSLFVNSAIDGIGT